MQLAIVKKKQCDAKALTIVEHLIEPNVDGEWLLDNLIHINRSHMEDVIEERAIIKLCGYVMCNKSLTVVITQQYHISTKKNKIYDVTRRKNFCSSRCYGACNYLLEQMLTSPLWLRETEETPVFRFLPAKDELERSTPGEEVCLAETDVLLHCVNPDEKEDYVESVVTSENTGTADLDGSGEFDSRNERELVITQEAVEQNANFDTSFEISLEKLSVNDNETPASEAKLAACVEEGVLDESENRVSPNVEVDQNNENKIERNQLYDKESCETSQLESVTAAVEENDRTREAAKSRGKKHKKEKRQGSLEPKTPCEFRSLATHVEESVKEWITENTLCLLSGEENTKDRLLENVTQEDKHLQLCKKLNKLQLEDDRNDRLDLAKNTLKPLPHLSVLREEGKKIELKVRAFYKGSTVIESPENVAQSVEESEESSLILPLTDAHAPKVFRRRIFLDKLNRILPDLLRALAGSNQSRCTYNSERSALIKALVNTFSLSAANIIFKMAEWTLVGLIVIKMLSIVDPQLKILLATRQASMYISMILMSYKLDTNYLDRLIIELTDNQKILNDSRERNF